ncbi:MAG: hypothetical protein ACLGPL_05115 [Acidobacteriota bacterium]
MNHAFRDELKPLMKSAEGPHVSVFMPTHRAGLETQQDPIRFDNLIQRVEKQLVDYGLRTPVVREMLDPARGLRDDAFFWRNQADGLALFLSQDVFRYFQLPIHFVELALVNSRFYIKPIMPLLSGDGHFFILSVSQKQVKLLRCTQFSIKEVDLEGTPKNIDQALGMDDSDNRVRFHTRVRGTMSHGESIFRGHGADVDDSKTDILRFLIKVNEGLHAILKDEQAPLVVAGVDYLLPLYREANTYPHLYHEGLTGNPDGLSPQDLHRQAWNLVHPHFQLERALAADKYMELTGTGLASNNVEEVVPASYGGRIDSIFIPVGHTVWGRYDADDNAAVCHEAPVDGDEDLLNVAAIQTMLNGGNVFAVNDMEVPGRGEVAAIFRY